MKRPFVQFLVLLISCLIFSNQLLAQVVATVGDRKITLKKFNERYKQVTENTINPPRKEVFLEDLIRFELGLMEAEKQKLKEDPIVAGKIEQEIYKGHLEKVLAEKINKIRITPDEMKKWYSKNPELRTSHILIMFKPGANKVEKAAAKKRALEIYKKVKSSKRSFKELVGLYSDDTLSKQNGGDIGWQSRVTLVPPYYEAASKLRKGALSNLIETQFGYHIIKLTGRQTFARANKQQIRAAVFDERRKSLFDAYFADLKKQYKIKKNTSILR